MESKDFVIARPDSCGRSNLPAQAICNKVLLGKYFLCRQITTPGGTGLVMTAQFNDGYIKRVSPLGDTLCI